MQAWIIEMMNRFGYIGIALLIAIENIFPPIPSEVILTFGGFMTTYSTMNVWLVILSSTVGAVAGALALYGVGRMIGRERLKKILSGKTGKILRLKPEDVEKAEGWFSRRGKATVFFCRFIPIVRSLISIPAGMAKMNLWGFVLLTTLGTGIWNTVLVWLGVLAGASWETIVGYMGVYSKVGLALLAVAGVIFLIVFYHRRSKKKQQDPEFTLTKAEPEKIKQRER